MVAPGASGRERENRPGGEKTREEEGEERGGFAWCSDQTAPTRGGVPASLQWPAGAAGGRGGVRLWPSESVAKLESLERAERAALVPVVVLKTGFYILTWCTFSTCLTLYNKSLLGDKLDKFPAPLLMNTLHFTLQAALSMIILLFQARASSSPG